MLHTAVGLYVMGGYTDKEFTNQVNMCNIEANGHLSPFRAVSQMPEGNEINPKKIQSFSVNRNFGLGQTPPSPFWINSEIKKYFFMSKKKYFEKFKKKTEYLMKKQSI